MNLHNNKKLFEKYIRETAKLMDTNPFYIEKDYYVTKMLHNISKSDSVKNISFKGGTSLSKAYNMILRFSEDVDLRIHDPENLTFGGGVAKRLYKSVEKSIDDDCLISTNYINSGTSLREQRFEFETIFDNPSQETLPYLKLEQNYQSSYLPMELKEIESYIGKTYANTGKIYDIIL
jgi:predicted nucleotidyltransferase component of viral defense system